MVNNKKIKDYFKLGMRKLKHRKGFGVHSPFAFSFITEVIEEKIPYYCYNTMQPLYGKQAPIPFKIACLLLRVANRFHFRTFAEIGCDGGYSMLPILLTDSRNHIYSTIQAGKQEEVRSRLKLFNVKESQFSFVEHPSEFGDEEKFDMLVVNSNPFAQTGPLTAATQLTEWILSHSHEGSVIFVKGIQPKQPLELAWDIICDREDVSITMDLFNNGIAILKPNFYKQHYIVSF